MSGALGVFLGIFPRDHCSSLGACMGSVVTAIDVSLKGGQTDSKLGLVHPPPSEKSTCLSQGGTIWPRSSQWLGVDSLPCHGEEWV